MYHNFFIHPSANYIIKTVYMKVNCLNDVIDQPSCIQILTTLEEGLIFQFYLF